MTEKVLLNNRYELLEPLGSGGMARVYKAKDLMLERLVAVKILKSEYSTNPSVQVRFRQEAKAIANLSHPNIVTIHDFGFDQKQLFLVMEYLPGKNLKESIKQKGYFQAEEALRIMIDVCAGLGYAHRAGIIHCDVKPHNILMTPDERVVVMDFGIARAIAGIDPNEESNVVWGSPLYFSPEQAAGKAPSPASDVYSAGVVMYEMLAGRPPFVAKTAESLARLHLESTPQPAGILNSSVSPRLEQVLQKVLSKEPALRYRTADQFGSVLSSIILSEYSHRSAVRSNGSYTKPRNDTAETAQLLPLPSTDWLTIVLALITILAVGGLIPLWLAIFLKWVNIIYR